MSNCICIAALVLMIGGLIRYAKRPAVSAIVFIVLGQAIAVLNFFALMNGLI